MTQPISDRLGFAIHETKTANGEIKMTLTAQSDIIK